MFYYIRGSLVLTEPGIAVVDCGGVGYKLLISDNTLGALMSMDKNDVLLYTYMYIREDALDLIGFATKEELAAFKLLISVSGIGPKAAMSILSLLSVERFSLAVASQDHKTIAKASGIGPKTAARIVLELKDKVAKELPIVSAETGEIAESIDIPQTGKLSEAESALMVLGYTKAEAQSALAGISAELTLEGIISAALKKMASRF